MKKIVFVCDGNNFSNEAFQFVKSLHAREPFLLTGAFFHSINYGLVIPNTFAPGAGSYLSFTEEENEAFHKGVDQFKDLCKRSGIEYRVHEESDSWRVSDLVKESRFADLLIVGGSQFFSNVTKGEAKEALQQALHRSECPVLVMPHRATAIDEIIFAYDGKKDSVYAIKQFIALFPHFSELETTIVYFNDDPEKEIPNLQYIEEFAARHFQLVTFEHVNLSKKSFSFWLNAHKDALLVTGAFDRSSISMAFTKSFAEEIINSHTIPVFISHLL